MHGNSNIKFVLCFTSHTNKYSKLITVPSIVWTSQPSATAPPFLSYSLFSNMLRYTVTLHVSVCLLTHWGRGHLNCLNARSRGLNNLNQLLYCVIQWLLPVVFRAVVFQVAGLVWSWGLCVRFAGCCSILQTGHITGSNHCIILLSSWWMGIVVPETCWASSKICNKNLCCI